MDLESYVGKRVKVITTDEQEFIGKVFGYVQALDNEPEIASIDLDTGEKGILYENEIKSIEVIE